jgi:hypothetical protein
VKHLGELKGQDLIQLLNTLAGEGTLNTPGVVHRLQASHGRGNVASLWIRENVLIHSHSTEFKSSLSSALIRRGLLDKNQVQDLKAFRKSLNPVPGLAALLRQEKILPEQLLLRIINHLNEFLAYEIMTLPLADFKLIKVNPATEDTSTFLAADLPLTELLRVPDLAADAEKNLPVLALIREKLNTPHLILKRTQDTPETELAPHHLKLFKLINGRNSLRDILLGADLDYFETYASLFQLLSWNIITTGSSEPTRLRKVSETPAARPTPRPSTGTDTSPPSPEAIPEPEQTEQDRLFLTRARGSDLFQVLNGLLAEHAGSGKLMVENQKNHVHSELMLYEGNLVHASSSMYSQRFGDLLVKKGLISQPQLEETLAEQKQHPGKHLGEMLVERQLIQPDTIPKIVYHQIECVLYEILSWSDAKFFFQAGAQPLQHQVAVSADYEIVEGRLIQRPHADHQGRDVLGDADKNLQILLMIKEKMPQPEALVHLTSRRPEGSLSAEHQHILRFVNGEHSINDILVLSDLDYFASYAALFQIYSAGLIEIQSPPQATTSPTPRTKPVQRTRPETPSLPPGLTPHVPQTPPPVRASTPTNSPQAVAYERLRKLLGDDILRALGQIPPHQAPAVRKALEALIEMGHSSR